MIAEILLSMALMTGCIHDSEQLSAQFEPAGADSVVLGDFRGAISYRYDINNNRIYFELEVRKDDDIVLDVGDYEIGLYDFSADTTLPQYTSDMDDDGVLDFILHCNAGSQQCCNEYVVYSLFEKPTMRDTVKCNTHLAALIDLDDDNIPEIYCGDDWFKGWKTDPEKSPGLRLVWKWDGDRYRLANFRFSDFLLNGVPRWWSDVIPAPDTSNNIGYDPNSSVPGFPPVELWSKMLMYIYTGSSDKADSLFNRYWPVNIPGRETFYRDFQTYLKDSDYYQQLMQSDW